MNLSRKQLLFTIITAIYCISLFFAGEIYGKTSGTIKGKTNTNHISFKALTFNGKYETSGTVKAGEIDSTFGINGTFRSAISFGAYYKGDYGKGLAVQADGKFVIAGYDIDTTGYESFVVARFDSNGTPDDTFGKNGWAKVSITGGTGTARANAVVIQSDGKIVLAGYSINDSTENKALAFARFNSNGTVDNTFGTNGTVRFNINGGDGLNDEADAVAVQSDGKILATGFSHGWVSSAHNVTNSGLVVVRLNQDGTLDNTFGINGVVRAMITGDSTVAEGNSIAVQPDGKIVVAGNANGPKDAFGYTNYFAVTRFNTNGTIDNTFGRNGSSLFYFNTVTHSGDCNSLALQKDGKIVLGGGDFNDSLSISVFAVARLNSDGSIDTAFGNDGRETEIITGDNYFNYYSKCIALQSDGKILQGGNADGLMGFALVRYNPDGSIDSSFGDSGWALAPSAGGNGNSSDNQLYGLALAPDGKIIAAGYSADKNINYAFSAARFFSGSASITAVKTSTQLPVNFSLSQNYPNPFNPSTTIDFSLPQSGIISLKVYDITGRLIKTLVNGYEAKGDHKFVFNADSYGLASGVYFYRLQDGSFATAKKLVLLK